MKQARSNSSWNGRIGIAIVFAAVTFALSWKMAMEANGATRITTGIVFSAKQAEISSRAQPTLNISAPYWTPSESEIRHLEDVLPVFLERSSGAAEIVQKLRSYRRQYFGYSSQGEKWILVNSFCASYWKRDASWQNLAVVVYDGGDCYFRVRYRVSSRSFSELNVNGES